MIMFDRDYSLRGKHATYVKYLDDTGVFDRYIDTYMIGAVMGFLHNRPVCIDTTSTDRANILTEQFAREKLNCEFIYRLVMLLDETRGLTLEQRIDRAFRDDADKEKMKENMELFHSYMRGGVEYLYEKFEECVTRDDYINKVYEIVYRFKEDIASKPFDVEVIIKSG